MQYLSLKVKPRWQEIEQENQLRNQKMWTWFVACTSGLAALSLLLTLLHIPLSLHLVLYYWAAFIILLFLMERRTHAVLRLPRPLALALACAAGAAAVLSRPGSALAAWPVEGVRLLLAICIPLCAWSALFAGLRGNPKPAEQLFSRAHLYRDLAAGLLGGVVLLFLLTSCDRFMSSRPDFNAFDLRLFIWVLCVQLGFAALAEEWIFRGIGFSTLRADLRRSRTSSILQLSLLNLLGTIVLFPLLDSSLLWVLLIAFNFFMAILSTVLRIRCESLTACLACNLVAHTILWVLVV